VIAIGLVVGVRGVKPGVQQWGLPCWQVSYGDGFIRRGLIGAVFQLLYGGDQQAEQSVIIDQISRPVVLTLQVGIAARLAILVARARMCVDWRSCSCR